LSLGQLRRGRGFGPNWIGFLEVFGFTGFFGGGTFGGLLAERNPFLQFFCVVPVFGGDGVVLHDAWFSSHIEDEGALAGFFENMSAVVVDFEKDSIDCVEGVYRAAFGIVSVAAEHRAGGCGGDRVEAVKVVLGFGVFEWFWHFHYLPQPSPAPDPFLSLSREKEDEGVPCREGSGKLGACCVSELMAMRSTWRNCGTIFIAVRS
jgi:hypothetical protein